MTIHNINVIFRKVSRHFLLCSSQCGEGNYIVTVGQVSPFQGTLRSLRLLERHLQLTFSHLSLSLCLLYLPLTVPLSFTVVE